MADMSRRELLKLLGAGVGGAVILQINQKVELPILTKPNCYVALYNETKEVACNGYARASANLVLASDELLLINENTIEFGKATGAWGTVTRFALFIDPGHEIARGWFVPTKTICRGDLIEIDPGNLQVEID